MPRKLEKIKAGKATEQIETTWKTKSGKLLHLSLAVSPILDEKGRIVGASSIARDITAEKEKIQRKRHLLEEQLQQAQKLESVGRLAGGIAHDFNNQLGVILGYTDMILERMEAESPNYGELVEIQKAAQCSAGITRQLLAFARKQTIAPQVLDLNQTVAGMLKMLQRLIGEDIELNWTPGQDLRSLRIDPSQIDQILANLSFNARDVISGTGKINIETGNASFDEEYCSYHMGYFPGRYVYLAVSDNGCGMDKQTVGHIFEPFFTTIDVDKGTGLGLATVYGIKQNNGYINVYSEPWEGTSLKYSFPSMVRATSPLPRRRRMQL